MSNFLQSKDFRKLAPNECLCCVIWTSKFWASVLNNLKNRKVEDILIACTNNLTGFSEAIAAVFPKTDIQNCIIH